MPPIDSTRDSLQTIEARATNSTEGFNDLSENVFGLIALVVSLVALLTTTLQVLHQYFASAEGYRRCHESVMGLWAKGTKRKLRWLQFRMEVIFETPVMFTAAPTNKFGPIKGRPIYYAKGTEDSYRDTQIEMPEAQKQALSATTMRVHTADDERASWVTLLSTLQNAEYFSRAWDSKQRTVCSTDIAAPDYPIEVALQKKTRSWDFLPPSVTKPYASSTICHLVEFMSMLGLHWKVFDEEDWNLRAEGNGFILTSTAVLGLGMMVVFEATGRSTFEERRVIPCKAIKDFSFGTVPTIFNDPDYLKGQDAAQSLDLVFGAKEDVNETLEALGCSFGTIEQYAKDHKHIFSVSFEIVGMLADVQRPRGSCFRMLPNPTSDYWMKNAKSKSTWEMTRLMEVFQWHIASSSTGDPPSSPVLTKLLATGERLDFLSGKKDTDLTLDMRETIHDILDEQTQVLLSFSQTKVLAVIAAHITQVIAVLSDISSPLNSSSLTNKEEILMQHYFAHVPPKVCLGPEGADERTAIWTTLMFRMLCWLLLHDFDSHDIMIVPSELRGSRMPIYIG